MKPYLKILLLALFPMSVHAQQDNPGVLRQALEKATSDSAKYSITFKLFQYYQEDKADSALNYIDQCLLIARENKYKINEADCLQNIGSELARLRKYAESFESFQEAFKIAEDPADENKAWKNDGKYSLHQNRLDVLGWAHFSFGIWGGYTISTEETIIQYRKALQLAEEVGDDLLMGLATGGVGDAYLSINKFDSALKFYKKAEQIMLRTSIKEDGSIYQSEGKIYGAKGDKKMQLFYYRKSLEILIGENSKLTLSDSYSALANYFLQEKQKDSSLYYAKKYLEVLNSIRSNHIGWAYLALSKSYELRNETDSAYKYQSLALISMDSNYQTEIKNQTKFQKQLFSDQMRAKELEQEKVSYQSKIRTNVLLGGLFALLVIAFFLFRNNRQKQKAKRKIEQAYALLKSTQSQLIQSEKMASLGELTAGIAHEIQNPLNFVNNFSEVNTELIGELQEEAGKGNMAGVKAIANDIKENEEKINHHGKRAGDIVKGMLQHSRVSTGKKEPTDINALADEYLRLSYHGLRAKNKSFNAKMETHFDESISKINIIPQDIGRVLLNLYNNAFYAVSQHASLHSSGQSDSAGQEYEPTVSVTTKKVDNHVIITVNDNGNGIPGKIKDKIFQPFFTTKPTGQGTGLGLSLSYDIVKAHGGEIKVESKEGEARPDDKVGRGTKFIILLPGV